jgi:hypothetical protein
MVSARPSRLILPGGRRSSRAGVSVGALFGVFSRFRNRCSAMLLPHLWSEEKECWVKMWEEKHRTLERPDSRKAIPTMTRGSQPECSGRYVLRGRRPGGGCLVGGGPVGRGQAVEIACRRGGQTPDEVTPGRLQDRLPGPWR